VHDIEFATEISQSLLAQVRQLQALLAERDETLKAVNLEKSRLELEAQGFSQRLKSLDESEQRYKDENWTLEMQIHDLMAASKQSADKEQRLQQALALAASEKSAVQRELDDIKQAHGKLVDEHTSIRKSHEAELGGLRRSLTTGENDKASLHRKVEELTSQNQELARAVAGHYKSEEDLPTREIGSEPEELYLGRSDHEYSPPGSPSKAANRHSMLESETLKSSLHHAHRMIQNLKSNIQREKTEKLELKRMLQESRDELEIRRSESGGINNANKRLKSKSQAEISRKARLGMVRNSRTDIVADDNDWEDQKEIAPGSFSKPTFNRSDTGQSDAYQTANETEDAFETANERETATESEAFMTGNEGLAGESSDELTETEGGAHRGRSTRDLKTSSILTARPGQRSSFISTASTSASDDDRELSTPLQQQPQKYRLKINRNARRSRIASENVASAGSPSTKDSPASFISNNGQTGQSLFAELGNFNADSGSEMGGTPSRSSLSAQRSLSALRPSASRQNLSYSSRESVPRVPMVDAGVMTEPWEPEPVVNNIVAAAPGVHEGMLPSTPQTRDIGVQRTPASTTQQETLPSSTTSTPRKAWDAPLKDFVASIPTFGPALTATPPKSIASDAPRQVQYADASTTAEAETSVRPEVISTPQQTVEPTLPPLAFSAIQSVGTEPIELAPAIPSRDLRRITVIERPTSSSSAISGTSQTETRNGGVIDSMLGWARQKRQSVTRPAEEDVQGSEKQPTSQPTREPFQEVAGNIQPREPATEEVSEIRKPEPVVDMADQSSQTILSAAQIDIILSIKTPSKSPPPQSGSSRRLILNAVKPSREDTATSPVREKDTSQDLALSDKRLGREAAPITKSVKRSSSSGSFRTSTTAMPPLPPDHRQAIAAAAAQRTSTAEASSSKVGVPSIMGPPTMPASAYRTSSARPHTPGEKRIETPNTRASTTPRARYSTVRSQTSRRSSVTSFESELDKSFNIRSDGMPMPPGMEPGADPRMIQAITQTMIGEYLWKYTRKPGRGEMSDNRHRRFFWVHPYTRTLYWSEQDPATAGRAQLKAKSVAIEGVRVVTDDNPMPPGLHRKSLLILTPGRAVKFTATTGQRHETWFNSLSYLILRTGAEPHQYEGGFTSEDIAEFNPSLTTTRNRSGSRATRASRASMGSYTSRPVTMSRQSSRTASPNRNDSALSYRPSITQTASPSLNPHPSQSSRYSGKQVGSVGSRFSNYWRQPQAGSVRESVGSRYGRDSTSGVGEGGVGSIYDASVVHDSAEDLRRVMEKQEEDSERLENVRACCDGKSSVLF
jgi:hypothetical protein